VDISPLDEAGLDAIYSFPASCEIPDSVTWRYQSEGGRDEASTAAERFQPRWQA
jgi:hypothetical protein